MSGEHLLKKDKQTQLKALVKRGYTVTERIGHGGRLDLHGIMAEWQSK